MIDIFNKKYCPCCNVQTENNIFYKAFGIPILNNVVYHTHQEGKDAQTGDVQLQACSNCGFFYNSSFNPKFIQYDSRYNSSRVYSSIFNQYLDQIVEHISTFTSKNENILELGCGDGEFLKKLCQKCSVQGFGYDISIDDSEKDSCNLF